MKAVELEKQEYPDSGQLSGLAAYCRDLYEEYRTSSYRKTKLEEINLSRERYKGDRDEKKFPWPGCSNKSLMLDAIAVDNIEPKLMAQLFGDDDFIQAAPVGQEDMQGAKQAEEFLRWAMQENVKVKKNFRPIAHDLLIDGTVFVLPLWNEETRISTAREQREVYTVNGSPVPHGHSMLQRMISEGYAQSAGMEEATVEREIPEFRIDLDMIPVSECFFPDNGDAWDTQPFLRLIYPTLWELEDLSDAKGGPYKNISADLLTLRSRTDAEERDEDAERKDIKFSEYTKEIPLLECIVKWQNEWILATFAHEANWEEVRRQKLGEVYPHGRKPVIRFSLFRENNESMGTGIPKKIRHYSTGCDDLYNQMIDCGTIEIVPGGFMEWAPGMDDMDLRISPGGWPVIPKGAVPHPFDANVKSQQFIQFIELLLGFQERLIALMDHTMSGQINRGSAGSETYAGMSLLLQESNIKHNYTGETLRDVLAVLVKDMLCMYGAFMPFDAKQRIFENNEYIFRPFDMKAVQGEYDITIRVSDASANKMLNRQEKVEIFKSQAENPIVNIERLTSDFLESYDIRNVEEYIKPEVRILIQALNMFGPEVVQVVQQFAQQKQAQMQQEQIAKQAQANIERQAIEREVERPHEPNKLMDQVAESAKRKLITPMVENAVAQDAMA